MKTKLLVSKPAVAVYVSLAVLIASVFGLQQTACSLATATGFQTELCVAE